MQKGQTGILILAGIVLLVAVAGGIFFLGRVTAPKPQSQTPVTTSSPQPSPLSTEASAKVEDETADWKTYTSTKVNYSFRYPEEKWPLVNIPPSKECDACIETIIFTPAYNPNSGDATIAVVLVYKEARIKSLEDYIQIHVKGDSSKVGVENTTVAGEKAVSYRLSGGIPPLPVIEYAVVKNSFYYVIRLEDSIETNKDRDQNIKIFNHILSTFTFIPQ